MASKLWLGWLHLGAVSGEAMAGLVTLGADEAMVWAGTLGGSFWWAGAVSGEAMAGPLHLGAVSGEAMVRPLHLGAVSGGLGQFLVNGYLIPDYISAFILPTLLISD